MDCAIRMDQCKSDNSDKLGIPGVCAVGRIVAVSNEVSDEPLKIGDRIATILVQGGNSRYAVQSLSRLVKISDTDDSKDICGLISSYFVAFASLQYNNNDVTQRYKIDSLMGKTILVNGGMSVVGQAVVHLSNYLGANSVYATGKQKDFNHLKSIGSIPLYMGPLKSNQSLEKKFDIIIDCTSYDSLDNLASIKKNDGVLIFHSLGDISQSGRHSWRTDLSTFFLKLKLLKTWNAKFFDPINEIFVDNFDKFKVRFMDVFHILN